MRIPASLAMIPESLQARAFYGSTPGDGLHSMTGLVAEHLTGTPQAPILIRGESLEAIVDSSGSPRKDALRLDHCSRVMWIR